MTGPPATPPDEEQDYVFDPELKFQHPALLEFLAYCERKRGGRQFAGRADIVPRELINLLPWLVMYDAVGADVFRVRLVGTSLAAFLPPVDWRGKLVTGQPELLLKRIQRSLVRVVATRAPLRALGVHSSLPGQDFRSLETCYVPLSGNGTGIDIVIAVSQFLPPAHNQMLPA